MWVGARCFMCVCVFFFQLVICRSSFFFYVRSLLFSNFFLSWFFLSLFFLVPCFCSCSLQSVFATCNSSLIPQAQDVAAEAEEDELDDLLDFAKNLGEQANWRVGGHGLVNRLFSLFLFIRPPPLFFCRHRHGFLSILVLMP